MKKKNIAIVTGASSGLGKEFVKLLSAKKGLDEIWIISRNEEKLKKIQKRYGEKIVVYPMDLSSLENIKAFGENPSLKNCNIRYLINNAGFAKFCSYDDISIDESINMIDLNISGVVAMGLVCIPHMKKGSHILNIASQASFQPLPYQNIYSSTKAFVRNYTRALNVELREKGITATAVCPGWMKTGLYDRGIIDAKKAELGLDQPFLVQYVNWMNGFLHGDMGTSYVFGKKVFDEFVSKLPATLLLTVMSILATVVISIPLGVLAAVCQDKWVDLLLRFFSFIGNAMPNFFVAMLLMQLLSIKLNLLPVIASGVNIRSALMPMLTLAISMSAKYMRQVRAAVLEELNKDYVQGARARGIRESVILWKNVIKSAMLTIITLLALSIGSLLGGTAIIESIFMWDGVGKLAVDAITTRDYPMIQAYVVWMALIYVIVNLITDLLYHCLDPRIRLGVNQNG